MPVFFFGGSVTVRGASSYFGLRQAGQDEIERLASKNSRQLKCRCHPWLTSVALSHRSTSYHRDSRKQERFAARLKTRQLFFGRAARLTCLTASLASSPRNGLVASSPRFVVAEHRPNLSLDIGMVQSLG